MSYRSFASLLLLAAAACSSSSPSTPETTGVNDVLLACQVTAQWANASSSPCSECIGLAETPRCACTDRDYAGKCSDARSAMLAEPTCAGVDTCVHTCARTDCACQDSCYAGKPACRVRASAADGCLAAICASYCR